MKKKKKFVLAALSAMLMLVGVLNVSLTKVQAASKAEITVSAVKGCEGDTVMVDVSVTENPGMCGMTIGIKYDKEVLTVVSAVGADDVFSSDDAIINAEGEGLVAYMYGGLKDKTETGKLMTITFKINEGAAIADSAVTVGDVNGNMEASNFDGDTVELATVAGKVTVECKHAETKEVVTKEATCTSAGTKATVCEKCDATVKTTAIAALGHAYGEYVATVAPTCTEVGEAASTCAKCEDTQKKEVAALGHTYGEQMVVKEPTATETGEAKKVCETCGDEVVIELPMIGTEEETTTEAETEEAETTEESVEETTTEEASSEGITSEEETSSEEEASGEEVSSEDASNEEDISKEETSKEGVSTGDVTGYVMPTLILCILCAGAIVTVAKRKNA
ncbi:MAG: hypothetical protein E7269_03080 [Lachnospiraceae bacterium]|nr:hypothetical protein [Lachnospiraceae bacterium]